MAKWQRVVAAALTIKSGNAVILRGGKKATQTNQAFATVLREALFKEGMNPQIPCN
ncbi:hypothetical protein G6R30_03390 [Fructobacillus sp. S1-1]|uniref:Uncharacterized protein n=1 Tax=Fructobacillus parabroussonetiae TaxID=2713174 RepID=A0ABS5QWB7_9LACO|nr:hypothetical protein [Fructobacillus parabroussonetiae]